MVPGGGGDVAVPPPTITTKGTTLMAQSLSKKDSPAKIVRTVRRHLRLTRRTGIDAAFEIARRIEAPMAKLDAAMTSSREASDSVEDAFDAWVQDDRRLDRSVKRLHRRSADYDMDHPPSRSVALIFQNKAPSEITNAAREDEPELVDKLVERASHLPDDHPARTLLSTLSAEAQASREGRIRWVDARKAAAVASAGVEVARLAVVRVYKDSIIDIGRTCGEDIADDCFPVLRRVATDDDETEENPES